MIQRLLYGTTTFRPITWTKQTIRRIRKKKGAKVNPQNQYPSKEDLEWYSKQSMYVGFHKPVVDVNEEPVDKHAWKRREAANRLSLDDKDLADEPDDGASSPSEAWA